LRTIPASYSAILSFNIFPRLDSAASVV